MAQNVFLQHDWFKRVNLPVSTTIRGALRTAPYHLMPRHITLHCTASHHTLLCNTTLYHTMPHRTLPHDNTIPHDVTLTQEAAQYYNIISHKDIKGHTAYFRCEKITLERKHDGKRVTFPDVKVPLHTDEQFRDQVDADHHHGISPLLALEVDLVSTWYIWE